METWSQEERVVPVGLGVGALGDQGLRIPRGGITVVAGASGEGKTSALLNMVFGLLRHPSAMRDGAIHFVTYEEGEAEIALKLILLAADVVLDPVDNIGAARRVLTDPPETPTDDEQRLLDAGAWYDDFVREGRLEILGRQVPADALASEVNELHELGLEHLRLGTSRPAPREEAEGTEVVKHRPLGALFVDYIQRVEPPESTRNEMRYLQVAAISRELLEIAVERRVPVVVGAQLNRGGRQQNNTWPPTLESIRESANIGQDAAMVLALRQLRDRESQDVTPVEVHIVKARDARAGAEFKLSFRGATRRLHDAGVTDASRTPWKAPREVQGVQTFDALKDKRDTLRFQVDWDRALKGLA